MSETLKKNFVSVTFYELYICNDINEKVEIFNNILSVMDKHYPTLKVSNLHGNIYYRIYNKFNSDFKYFEQIQVKNTILT